MAVDPRQIVAGFLTLTMFVMLANMVKNDHFDTQTAPLPSISRFTSVNPEVKDVEASVQSENGPWEENSPELSSCWRKPVYNGLKEDQPERFITLSLTRGPEYHVSQVTAAVVVASYLGATIVLPDIRGREVGQERKFEDVYDVQKFVTNLGGSIKIVPELPDSLADIFPTVLRVPNRITEDYIMKNIKPIFENTNYVKLAVYFPSTNMKIKDKDKNEMTSIGCLAMFEGLELKPELIEAVDLMVNQLKILSSNSGGRFIAVDLRTEILENKGCHEGGKKTCYNAQEIAAFLKRIGVDADTTIYLTQNSWHESLNVLKEHFPKTYTKEDILPNEKKNEVMLLGSTELENVLDFYICSESDIFVPAISGVFYGNVAGRRIASGGTQILVPKTENELSSPSKFISSFISKKTHLAYLCYC